MHKNSVKAYHAIKSEIPAKEREVLHMIKMYGPINGRMLDVRISGGHKRIKNLMDMGCIGIAYIADDAVTGRETNYYMWLTDKPKEVKTVRKNCKALDLGNYYDNAFAEGVRHTVVTILKAKGLPVISKDVEKKVQYICEKVQR